MRNTNRYRRPREETEAEFTAFLLDELEAAIEQEWPDTVAMVIMEPVQNAGGSFTPPEGYFTGVRELCDRHGILLCAVRARADLPRDDRGDPVVQISPPLVAGPAEFDEIAGILGDVLEEAWDVMTGGAGRPALVPRRAP